MKKYLALLLILTMALMCPTASAANGVVLEIRRGSGDTAQLTLGNLGNKEVNSVQLELTFGESYPNASFADEGGEGRYSRCKVDTLGSQTVITIYIDGATSMNRGGSAPLGTLTLGGGYTAPSSVRLTTLGHNLGEGGGAALESISVENVSSGSSGGSSSYAIRVTDAEHGSITVKPARAERGDTVTITVQPDTGFHLDQLTATASGRQLELKDKGNGTYTFTMPGSSVEVRGTFTASDPADLPFTDVAEGIWYENAVRYVYENKLMAGTGSDTFGPDLATSRGMIVTILYRMAGSPTVGACGFTDVAAGQYYTDAIAWAAEKGVVSGYGGGLFGPDDPITREQMTLILQGYARLSGKDVSARADLSAYTDAGEISGYAQESMSWARAVGLVNGTSETTLTPSGTATRAQAAVLFQGFCENVMAGK